MPASRGFAFLLLALAMLFWAGNWVIGRALREAIEPFTLNFVRWAIAALILAPFTLPSLAAQWPVIRRHWPILLLLALTGVSLFHALVYLGLRSTTTVNGILLNSSLPLFILACSWILERERAKPRQLGGLALSLAGILVILSRGEPASLLALEVQAGDAWILLAMPVWGLYSVLLKRRPAELGGLGFLFAISALGTLLLVPAAVLAPPRWPGTEAALGIAYIAVFASILAFICWNRGVAIVGANVAGITLHLLPLFGTALAILFLDEAFRPFHAVGFATILAGVIVATRRA
ncbi:MAG: DMT family transporter [Betaproteobacteria bacterium]|nr:DMT family transporter [Betaproteobacteria bacterium]MDH5220297.1 DMT family transporter [Betaproteobacteria bacterium]MDH5351114.1 DMT family transporter [Betaproteobacteria bacterium]